MQLLNRLQEDMKAALKGGQKARLSVIRMMLSDVKNIDLAPKPTTAEDAVEAYGKRLKKSLEEYDRLKKTAEVEQLRFEIGVVEEYLPKKLSPEETTKLVDAYLAGKAFTPDKMGQAIGGFMKAHGQEVDPGIASGILKKRLSGPPANNM